MSEIYSLQQAWQRWWDYEGSAMRPHPSEDTEQFAKRITQIAWANGGYARLGENERLRAKVASVEAMGYEWRWTKSIDENGEQVGAWVARHDAAEAEGGATKGGGA